MHVVGSVIYGKVSGGVRNTVGALPLVVTDVRKGSYRAVVESTVSRGNHRGPKLRICFYRDSDGREPVDEFISGLPPAHQASIDSQLAMLEVLREKDPPPEHPASSQIEGELRELRYHHGSVLYRILYRRSGNFLILLHMLRKNTGNILERDKQIARDRWNDFKSRMNADPRVPPRPIGHDAV
jgi:phage-related protein